jgi:hydroxyacyl-ACP dehydratase HTD2-like protein with hotdog domain
VRRCYEQVTVGETLELLEKGPLTSAHLMRWSAAMENWHKIHYDRQFAVEHDKLPGILVNGTLKQQFIMQALRQWAGHDGWVWKVSFQFRAMNVEGETLAVWGRVTGKRKSDRYGLVDLELGILNNDKKESTPGAAVIALPYEKGEAVPYPFVVVAGE